MGWQTFGKLEVKNDGPFEYNPHYVRLSPSGYPHKWTSLENEGYFGIGVKKGEQYRFSVWTRIPDGKEAVNYQSYGWGFFEFFQLAEEIGATPLPVLSYGPACQFQNNSDHSGSQNDVDNVHIQEEGCHKRTDHNQIIDRTVCFDHISTQSGHHIQNDCGDTGLHSL